MRPDSSPKGHTWPPPPAFWSKLPSLTQSLTAPANFKALMPEGTLEVDAVLDALSEIGLALTEGRPCASRVRVYVDEDRRDDLVERMLKSERWPGTQAFEAWAQALVGADRFGLIINNLEVASEAAASALAPFVRALFAGWGVPVGGVEQAVFAGNYSSTAFGVHEGFEDAFLFHLGPGTKQFYCWSNKQYADLTGGVAPTYTNFHWLLDSAEQFTLEPGDVLFLPRRVFHVGIQEEFSVSIALPLYAYPDSRYLALGVLPEVTRALLGESADADEPSTMHDLAAGPAAVSASLAPLAQATLALGQERLPDLLAQVLEGKWKALMSNGGWEVVGDDLARSQAAATSTPRMGDVLKLRAPYSAYSADGDAVYLRGVAVRLDLDSASAKAVVAALNNGDGVEVDEDNIDVLAALAETGGTRRCMPELASEWETEE